MRILPRVLAILAIIVLLVGVPELVTGLRESAEQDTTVRTGLRKIPRDSEFVRSLMAEPLQDDLSGVNRVYWLLYAAGRGDEAQALQEFVGACNVLRLSGHDDACRSEKIAAAIAKGRALPGHSAAQPVPVQIASVLEHALTFDLPEPDELSASTDEATWKKLSYESPGIVHDRMSGTLLFIAARNESPWRIGEFQAVLSLRLSDASHVELKCSTRNPWPFYSLPAGSGERTIAHCARPENVSIAALRDAWRGMHDSSSLDIRWVQLDLQNPYVRVQRRGVGSEASFEIVPVANLLHELRDRAMDEEEARLPHQLAVLDCARLDNCPRASLAAAMAVAQPFNAHPFLLPVSVAVLLGVAIGGLFRRPLSAGAVVAGLLIAGAALALGWAFQSVGPRGSDRGFELLGILALTYEAIVAFTLGLPVFFLTIACMRWLHARAAGTNA
jgi:hypothetical protein